MGTATKKELRRGLTFVDPDSHTGRQAVMNEDIGFIRSFDPGELIALDEKGDIYCVVGYDDPGWIGRIGEHELTAIHPTLEACKETMNQRYIHHWELSDYEEDILERWSQRDFSVEPYLGGLLGASLLCREEFGFDIIIKMYRDDLRHAQVYDLNHQPSGLFKIKKKPPRKEDDIVGVNREKCGVLTLDTKKKILRWAYGRNYSLPNWELMILVQAGVRRSL